jgi:hypothetical protein
MFAELCPVFYDALFQLSNTKRRERVVHEYGNVLDGF